MTNVYKEPRKLNTKQRLFSIGLETLTNEGYTLGRIKGTGYSVRSARKGNKTLRVTIRTSQNQWFAFPRTADDKGWLSLDDADLVVVITTDGEKRNGIPFIFPADEVRRRFDALYAARIAAGHSIPVQRGVWLSLFTEDTGTSPIYTEGGIGNIREYRRDAQPLGTVDDADLEADEDPTAETAAPPSGPSDDGPLTIPEAKRRLALTFGVDPSAIKITVEG